MNIESAKNNIDRSQEPVLQEVELRSGLARSIRVVADLRRKAEQNGLAAGSHVAEQVILQNIPVMEHIVDGDLRTELGSDANNIENRVNSLPLELVTDTQGRIHSLLSIMNGISSVASANRLERYFPLALPKTREGFGALQFISRGYATVFGIPRDEALVAGVNGTTRTLSVLDSAVSMAARKDEPLIKDLLEDVRGRARLKLPDLLEEDSDQVRGLRSMIAEQKLSQMRRKVVQTNLGKNYSEYEVLINDVIEKERLSEQTDDAQRKREVALEKAKEEVFANLARKRAIQTVVLSLDEDLLLCAALAKRERMTTEELLTADESVKRRAANNALNGKIIVLSEEQRRVFNASRILANERQRVEEELRDPVVFISKLSEEEITVIRNKIPRISDRRSVFYLARDRVRQQVEDEVTNEELVNALAQQITIEMLSRRSTMAVDLAIRDLGINPDSLFKNSPALLQSIDNIVANALPYLRFDSPPLRLLNVEVEGLETDNPANILEMEQFKCLTEGNVVDLLEKMSQSPDIYGVKISEREGVKKYMVDQKARETLVRVSRFLADLTKISDKIILPETENEMSCLLTMVVNAITTGEPITLVTPICPDWSRDEEGKYDFKSLGGGESYIGRKFLTYGREMLAVFAKYRIPFKGVLQFADWGLETEINAKDTFGRKLSPEDIQMCFQSTLAATDEHLRSLQLDEELGSLFENYSIVSMKESIESKIDVPEVQARLEKFLTSDIRGRRLIATLEEQSYKINQARLGLNRSENRKMALQNLVEYATEGQSIGPHSILVVCESRTTSRVYNLPRQKDENIPVFFVRGKEGVDEGVNIL